MEHVRVNGLRIAYRRAGAGPPLLLLHGILQDSRAWRWQTEALSEQFTVLAWDAPGCGSSDDPPATYRMPDYADRLAEFVEVVGVSRLHVLGLSLGAVLALELYRRHPRLPRSLILSSAYAGWAGSLPADEVARRREHGLREAGLPARDVVPRWLPGIFTENAPREMVEITAAMMSDFHPGGYRTMTNAVAEADLRDVLPTIEVPTLLLYGAVDRRSPLAVAEDLHRRIPNSTLAVLDGVGHLCNVEAADRFNAQVLQFLAAVSDT